MVNIQINTKDVKKILEPWVSMGTVMDKAIFASIWGN